LNACTTKYRKKRKFQVQKDSSRSLKRAFNGLSSNISAARSAAL
jgi:hypothetical protein